MVSASTQTVLRENLDAVEGRIVRACERAQRARDDVTMIAVTKTVSAEIVAGIVELGVHQLGESRPQELWRKESELPSHVSWHLVGHLQTNKIARTVPMVTMIHSADREHLLVALEAHGRKCNQSVDVLMEVNASGEASKHGFNPDAMTSLAPKLNELSFVRVHGLMTMAAWEEDPEACRPAFALLRQLRDQLRGRLDERHPMTQLSMGMSNDFEVAVEEGATMIRLGTALFENVA